jgi:hypothetical protein
LLFMIATRPLVLGSALLAAATAAHAQTAGGSACQARGLSARNEILAARRHHLYRARAALRSLR